jgi:hypothetical protein
MWFMFHPESACHLQGAERWRTNATLIQCQPTMMESAKRHLRFNHVANERVRRHLLCPARAADRRVCRRKEQAAIVGRAEPGPRASLPCSPPIDGTHDLENELQSERAGEQESDLPGTD